ncbi:DNA methyltransferase [Cryobacterium sp. Y62]|uniref:class I SAM-dependent DNA methyltransferase n=1 Tax=Cryobacterium sp. Y62 TaxID=2048284 RepID=UPI000CE3C697|nr:DNA methyltransferase [Cryobacterium sp. Y62]
MTDNLLTLVDIADFRTLFIEELGWSNPDVASREITTSAGSHSLSVVASYKSLRIWYCSSLPDRKVQREIDHQLSLDNHERLVIFSNDDIQEWRWPRRAQLGGANAKLVLHRHKVGEPDLRLAKRLDAIRIDFEQPVTLVELLGRMRDAFDAESETASAEAARLMGTLYSELEAAGWTSHDATLLLGRVLFLYFGDDSGMWDAGAFEKFLIDHTNTHDLAKNLQQLFDVVNTDTNKRDLPNGSPFAGFRYINGGIFADPITWGPLSEQFRDDLINASDFNWSLISPAVFGSMFQTVKSREARRHGGEHYTTEKNILRTIEPLFLKELRSKLAAAWNDRGQLTKLHNELGRIRVLDPACGCGNFLIVAYRELRALELDLMLRSRELQYQATVGDFAQLSFDVSGEIKVTLDHFYGIEIEEWPARIAETALLLMDHLANLRMADDFGAAPDRLPIRIAPKIVRGSALSVDWDEVVPAAELTYIVGNPPFNGSRTMSAEQKAELRSAAGGLREAGFLDYVAGWYLLASRAMERNPAIKCGLVSTNSITQGEQSAILWRPLFQAGVHINFAHRSFIWENESSGQAAVHCVIIGFSRKEQKQKRLYSYIDGRGEATAEIVDQINAYLIPGDGYVVGNRQEQISGQRKMAFGNMAADNGRLILSESARTEILETTPGAESWILPFIGAAEFLNGGSRYCLWLEGITTAQLEAMPAVIQRVEAVRAVRADSARPQLATTPHLFAQITQRPNESFLLIPSVSSERRRYVPMGFFEPGTIASNACLVIEGASMFEFGILTSEIHMDWMRTVGGRLKSDYRYSKDVVYNNFVFPAVSAAQRTTVESLSQAVIDARAAHPTDTLAKLYDNVSMPSDVRAAHAALDRYVDLLYRPKPFESARERVAHLLALHRAKENEFQLRL